MKEITRIALEGLVNTRDLGGFETADGRRIKPGRLIRSGQLFEATPKDIEKLVNEYHLKTIVDFRTETERRGKPDPVIDGVTYIANPILNEETMGITRENKNEKKDGLAEMIRFISADDFDVARYMAGIYGSIVSDAGAMAQYKKFFEILLHQEEGAVLWHCSAGKDRVGVGTALLLTALGVPRDVIIKDYVKVNDYVKEKNERDTAFLLRSVEAAQKVQLRERIEGMFTVREAYMIFAFDKLEAIYGSVENCLEMGLGLDREKMTKLKAMYLYE